MLSREKETLRKFRMGLRMYELDRDSKMARNIAEAAQATAENEIKRNGFLLALER